MSGELSELNNYAAMHDRGTTKGKKVVLKNARERNSG